MFPYFKPQADNIGWNVQLTPGKIQGFISKSLYVLHLSGMEDSNLPTCVPNWIANVCDLLLISLSGNY